MLKREDITQARIDALVAEGAGHGYTHFLSREAREESRRLILAARPAGQPVWVFGYGSLIWNPAFHFVEQRPALLRGYHRRFCFWTPLGRGTPDCPGLMLALERGGQCQGVAFRIAEEAVESETDILWMREMLSGVYRPRWVRLQSGAGVFSAIVFVINRHHPLYAGRLPLETAADHIARAEGRMGPCRDYLRRTVEHLEALGIPDRQMGRLLRLVDARRAAAP